MSEQGKQQPSRAVGVAGGILAAVFVVMGLMGMSPYADAPAGLPPILWFALAVVALMGVRVYMRRA